MSRSTITTLLFILLVATLMQISTDIYTPSLPAIAHYFGSNVGASQATMSLFILGVALTGLIYGPLSETIGRRKTLLIGVSIAVLGSLGCALSPSIKYLQLARFIQGCGLGAASALWRTLLRDYYSGDELSRIVSYLINGVLVSVVLAPFIGGYIEHYGNWRITFAVLTGWSLFAWIISFKFKEVHQIDKNKTADIRSVLKIYGQLIRCKSFITFNICTFLAYGGLFTWFTSGPVVLIKGADISAVLFGWLSIIIAFAMFAGGTVNAKLVRKLGSKNLLQIGTGIMTVAGVIMFGSYYLWGINVYDVLIPSAVFIFGSTLVFPNAFANAFENIGHIAGYGGGLYSSIQLAGGALFSAILSHVSTTTQLPMAALFIASGLLSWITFNCMHGTKLKENK